MKKSISHLSFCALPFFLLLITSCAKKDSVTPTTAKNSIIGMLLPGTFDAAISLETQKTPGYNVYSLNYSATPNKDGALYNAGTILYNTKPVNFDPDQGYRAYSYDLQANNVEFLANTGQQARIQVNDAYFGAIDDTVYNPKPIACSIGINEFPLPKIPKAQDIVLTWTPDSKSKEQIKIMVRLNTAASNAIDSTFNIQGNNYYKLLTVDEAAGTFTIPASTYAGWPTNTAIDITVARGNFKLVTTTTGKSVYIGGYSLDFHAFWLVP